MSRLLNLIKNWRDHRGALASWFNQLCSAFGVLATLPLINRSLGEINTGIWLTFQSLAAAAALSDLGVGFVAGRQIAFSLGGGLENKLSKDFDSSYKGWAGAAHVHAIAQKLNKISCLLAGIVLLILGFFISHNEKLNFMGADKLMIIWSLLAIALIFTLLGKPDAALLEGSGHLALSKVLAGGQTLTTSLGAAVTVLLGGDLTGMAIVAAASGVLFYTLQRIFVRRLIPVEYRKGLEVTWLQCKRFAKVAFKMGILLVGSYLVIAIQIPLVGLLISPSLVAPYFLAQRCCQFANGSIMQLTLSKLPAFSELIGAGRYAEARHFMLKYGKLTAYLSIIAAVVFFLTFPIFYSTLLGKGDINRLLVAIIIIDYLLANITVVWGQFVLAAGDNPFTWVVLATGALNLLLLTFFIPLVGVVGVALASLAANCSVSYWFNVKRGCILLGKLKPVTVTSR